MIRPAQFLAWTGTLCAAALAGCVTETNGPPRTALWSTHGSASDAPTTWGRKERASPQMYLKDAQFAESNKRYDEARASYETVLGIDARSFEATIGLARVDQLAGRTEKAEKGFKRALQLRPNDPVALDAIGQFYASKQRWPEAIHHLQQAAAVDPDNEHYHFHLGLAIARSGDPESAIPRLAKAVGEAKAHYNVGYVLYEKGDMAAAEKHFLTASLKQPNLAVAQTMLDEVRNSQGQPKVLPASSKDKPRLERSLPFPVADRSQRGPMRADYDAPRADSEYARNGAAEPVDWNGGMNADRGSAPLNGPLRPTTPDLPAWPGHSVADDEGTVPFGSPSDADIPARGGASQAGHSIEPEPYSPRYQQFQNQRRQ